MGLEDMDSAASGSKSTVTQKLRERSALMKMRAHLH